jgi:hypothetical protein
MTGAEMMQLAIEARMRQLKKDMEKIYEESLERVFRTKPTVHTNMREQEIPMQSQTGHGINNNSTSYCWTHGHTTNKTASRDGRHGQTIVCVHAEEERASSTLLGPRWNPHPCCRLYRNAYGTTIPTGTTVLERLIGTGCIGFLRYDLRYGTVISMRPYV